MHDAALDYLQMQLPVLRNGEQVEYPSKSSLKASDRKLGQWLANQRHELVCGISMPVERKTSLESSGGRSRFAEKLASPKDLAASKGAGAGKGSKPHVQNGFPKPAARGSCGPGDMPGQPLGKRLRVKTSLASLEACMARGEQ